jgi:hypothetical protein
MSANYPSSGGGLLSSINFKSPMTWLIIGGGGIAAFLLFRHFFPNGITDSSSSSGSSTDTGTSSDSEGYTEENVYQQTLSGPQPPGGTGSNGITPVPPSKTGAGTVKKPAPAEKVKARRGRDEKKEAKGKEEHRHKVVRGRETVPPVEHVPPTSEGEIHPLPPEKETGSPPGPVPAEQTNGRFPVPPDTMEGTGPGDTMRYVHVPTWPYGGQMSRTRLG